MNYKKKIFFFIPSLNSGGAERVCLNFFKSVDIDEYDPYLILINNKSNLNEDINFFKKYNNKIIDLNAKKLIFCFFKINNLLKDHKPHYIFSTHGYINLFLLMYKFLGFDFKIIIREANMPSISLTKSKFFYEKYLFRRMYKFLYPKADKIIASSSLMANELSNMLNINQNIITKINNPIDTEFIINKSKYKNPINKINKNDIQLVCSGRLVYQKGFDLLIKIFTQLPDNFYLTILGDGPEKNNLINIVKKNKLTNRIFFLNYIKNPWIWYQNCDAVIIPSRWEGMSNTFLESLLCKANIIISDKAGGFQDLIKNNLKISVYETEIEMINLIKNVQIKKNDSDYEFNKNYIIENFDSRYISKIFKNLLKSLI